MPVLRSVMALQTARRTCARSRLAEICKKFSSSFRPKFIRLKSSCRYYSRYDYTTRKPNLVTPVFLRAENFLKKTAIIDQNKKFTYADLLHYSSRLSKKIVDVVTPGEKDDVKGARIAFLCDNDVSYVVTQWAIWMAGGVAVPLCRTHPVSELEYFIQDSESSLLVVSDGFQETAHKLDEKLTISSKILQKQEYTDDYSPSENAWFETDIVVKKNRRLRVKNRYDDLLVTNQYKHKSAMIVYTSGTTGRPKGVVMSFGNLHAMAESMIQSWGWKQSDVILHVLPLHHVHGIVNTLMTPLHCGACCVMLPKFDAQMVWSKLLNPTGINGYRVNLFMAVPTVYAKMIENYETRIGRGRGSRWMKEYIKSSCLSKIRLMVSGSAALPQPIMDRWEEITGHRLLERYGMTEIGMALTNPLHGTRTPGCIGIPMPRVEVCIAQPNVYAKHGYDVIARGNSRATHVTAGLESEPGELMVKGPSVFNEYYNRPEETNSAFTKDGWFKTGDTVSYQNGVYKILGRTSVDLIKSGGYKISALEVERHLLAHPDIADCSVVGLPDITWGQRVAAVVVLKNNKSLTLDCLRSWARDKMATYQIPTVLKSVPVLPRSPIGKVNKKELLSQMFPYEMKRVV